VASVRGANTATTWSPTAAAIPRRVNVRGPSYTHAMALLERLIVNLNISDVAALMVSLHTYPPEIER
jgi:NADH:ubiquinone oxidoreductase subunit D